MKNRSLLILLCTVLLSWILPNLYHMFTANSSGRLFVYYSAITKHFCVIEKDTTTKELVRKDITTDEHYTINQFDSILPLLYYRQLLADGKMPKTIGSKAISAREASEKSFFFKYKPQVKNSPSIHLYPLFESASGRVDLKMPNDVFRLKEKIEFLIPETNAVDTVKSKLFQEVFDQTDFAFPAKQVAGNPSPNKPYDEGYFVIDAANKLYHFKMVKQKPFLKKVSLPSNFQPSFFAPYEPDDHSFYGFVFDQQGATHVLNTEDYALQKLQIDSFSLDDNFLVIMGNPLYWTVRIIGRESEQVFAFDAQTKQKIDQHSFSEKKVNKKWNNYIFPFELKWTNPLSKYIFPQLKLGNYAVFLLNVILVFLFFFIERKQRMTKRLVTAIWILLTGIFGALAIILLRK